MNGANAAFQIEAAFQQGRLFCQPGYASTQRRSAVRLAKKPPIPRGKEVFLPFQRWTCIGRPGQEGQDKKKGNLVEMPSATLIEARQSLRILPA